MAGRTVAATGGTFDIIHRGHRALLSAAMDNYDHVIIGLTTDGFAARRGKTPLNRYPVRLENLRRLIDSRFPDGSCEICPLEDVFGPAVLRESVDALVVSEETANQGGVLNRMRAEKGLGPVRVVVVPMVHAADGTTISSTNIRNNLMDLDGNPS